MSFGSKRLDDAYDRWVTTPPDEYEGDCSDDDHEICEDCGMCHICDGDCQEEKEVENGKEKIN